MFTTKLAKLASLFAATMMVFSLAVVGDAEARMGGSFGSRGMRTYSAPPVTTTAPYAAAPIQKSMTTPGKPNVGTQAAQVGQSRPGFWGGFGGGLLGGMLFSGLFGMMFGAGFGGFGGVFTAIIQILLLGWLISWAVRRFSRRPATDNGMAYAGSNYGSASGSGANGYGSGSSQSARPANRDEIGVKTADLQRFERLLAVVQDAFSREDHAGLRRLSTPEMVSYLSEELAENATRGVRNQVSDLKFLSGDVAESWREGGRDYATAALRWSARDVLIDRTTGAVVKGNPDRPVEATELWTFVRERGGGWKLSAIQEARRS
jgi:predicted lipid-binding transport protein (Tim44 family)